MNTGSNEVHNALPTVRRTRACSFNTAYLLSRHHPGSVT
uniref:Uncharacterized protein n=1 Tax=Anguilla anguilla TaxID=7936 RepID=A0A0E9TX55_ANGAN